MADVKDEISQRLLGVARRRMTGGDSAYATETWSSSSQELVHQLMQRSRSESFPLGRRAKRTAPGRDIFDDSFAECHKCAGLQEKAAKDKKKYFLEVEHLRRGITKCLDQLAATMTAGALDALRSSLQLDVHFFTTGEENNQEEQPQKEAKPVPSSSGRQAKQIEIDRLNDIVAKLEDEISALEKENARLQKEAVLAEVAARRAANVKTLHAQCQVDAGSFPGQRGDSVGGSSGGGLCIASTGLCPWDNVSHGPQHDGNYPPHAVGMPSGIGGDVGPSVLGGAGHNGGNDNSHMVEMERLRQELERTKRKLRGAERKLTKRRESKGGSEEGLSGGDDGANGAGNPGAVIQETSVAGTDRIGSSAQGSYNHQQPPTTTNNYQQPPTTTNNHQQPPTTTNNHQPTTTITHQQPPTTITPPTRTHQQPSGGTSGMRGSNSTGDSGGGGASASGITSSSGGGKCHRTKDKGAAGPSGSRRAHGTEAPADVDSREGVADCEQETILLGAAHVAPVTADKCVGGGPGPGLSDEPVRCRGKPLLPPKEMNKAGICFARRLRSQPNIAGLSASVTSMEGLMDSLGATTFPSKGSSSELRAANQTWPGFTTAASGTRAITGGGTSAVNNASGELSTSWTSPLERSAEPYLMHVWDHKRTKHKAKIEEELAKLGAMTPPAVVPHAHYPVHQK